MIVNHILPWYFSVVSFFSHFQSTLQNCRVRCRGQSYQLFTSKGGVKKVLNCSVLRKPNCVSDPSFQGSLFYLLASDGLYCYLIHVYWSVCFTTHSRQTRWLQNIQCTLIYSAIYRQSPIFILITEDFLKSPIANIATFYHH